MVISFKEAERMSDSRFRLLVEKITECPKTEEKIHLIQENLHSLQDYIDMLNSDCLFGDEYKALYRTFGVMELAILAKMVFYEELRTNSIDFSSLLMKEKETKTEWQMYYIEFLKDISKEQITSIEKCIQDIDFEEIKFY